jgi:ABC-type arginine transport system ATPase subunit
MKAEWKRRCKVIKVFKPNYLMIMKKVLVVIVLLMAVLVVNAQEAKTTVSKETAVRTAVLVADLQKAITDNIAKEYVGYTIKEATSVTTNGIVTYEVVVVKGTAAETLVYDSNGAFVKKCPPAAEMK